MGLGNLGVGTGHTMTEGILDNGQLAANVTADKYFKKISMADEHICSIQVNFNEDSTHTLAAVLIIQGSNHPDPTDEAAGTREWVDLDVVFPANITSGAGTTGVPLAYVGWRWIRVFVDFTSGSGSVVVRTVQKTK